MFASGGGNLRGVVTILGFVVGVTTAAWSFDTWSAWPILPTVSLTHQLGGYGAVAVHLGLVGLALLLATAYERYRRGRVEGLLADRTADMRLAGRWPLLWGALGLGLAAIAIVLLSGRPGR